MQIQRGFTMRFNALRAIAGIIVLTAAAISPAGAQNAFITNTSDNTVSIIDVPSGTVIGAVPVGSEPQGVAVAPNGTTAYVTNLFGPSLSVIDAAQFPQVVTATISTGAFPPGVALSPNGALAYVSNGLASTPEVSVINTASNVTSANIALPGTPAGVAVTPDGSRVYAPSGTTTGVVSVIASASNTISATIPVGANPDGIAITPNGANAYVTQNNNSGTVTVINTSTNAVSATIPVGGTPFGIAISPDGTKAFVANLGDNTVSVISTATNTVTATIPVGQGPFGVSFTADGTTAYVANKTDNTVSQIDVASNAVVATIAVGQAPAAYGSNFVGKALPTSALVSAVLPGGRSAQVGASPTVFATVINPSTAALNNCRIVLPSSAPAGMSMMYQTTNPATNVVNSGPNPAVSLAANGGSQSFVLTFQDTNPSLDPEQPLLFVCTGTTYAPVIVGVNSVDLQFSSTPIPDIVAIAATATNDGVVTVPLSSQEAGAFAIASDNMGSAGTITVSADTGSATLPLTITLCQTGSSGQCLAPPAPTVTLSDAANATPTFSVFVAASAAVAFSPAVSRIFTRFLDQNGVAHGSTSVAVQTD
jgi:YVTN family beta-propeller protein